MAIPAARQKTVIVGGSIAAVTAADSLRLQGYDGSIVLVSEESVPPYSRVPLSKGILAGSQDPATAYLPALPADIELRLGARARSLDVAGRLVTLDGGERLPYDGLIIATGARARRLAAAGQTGELAVRTIGDAQAVAARLRAGARTAVVVGAGFLGMEVASSLVSQGVAVTVVDADPPLERLVGRWLAGLMVAAAREHGVRFSRARDGVRLVGDPVAGIYSTETGVVEADLVISAVGDLPNVEWLAGTGLARQAGLPIDGCCRVAPRITAAGDVTVRAIGSAAGRRTPHWTSAVEQGRAAANALTGTEPATPYVADPYFWTEQFGLNVKISGQLPSSTPPASIERGTDLSSLVAQWVTGGRPVAAVSVNHRMPIRKLKVLSGVLG